MLRIKDGGIMKKKIIAILTASLLLSGCSTDELFGKTKPDFDKAYTTSAEISYGDYTASCDITRSSENEWSFSFTQPDYLMGMELSLCNDELSAQLGKLNVTAEMNGAYQLIPDIIAKSIDTLSDAADENITENEGILTINTEIGGKKVVVTSDKNGQLLTLKCPYHKLSVEFGKQLQLAQPDEIQTYETEDVSIIFDE